MNYCRRVNIIRLGKMGALAMLAGGLFGSAAMGADQPARNQASVAAPESVEAMAVAGNKLDVTHGKSSMVNLKEPISRLAVGNPAVADVKILNPKQLWTIATKRVEPPFAVWSTQDVAGFVDTLPIDPSVPEVAQTPGGTKAARARLREFVAKRLGGYAEARSEPASPAAGHASGLSPYLHFGHISIEAVVERVLASTGSWSPAVLRPGATGKREGFFCRDADVNAFLDEALTWRDVGFTWHRVRRRDTANLYCRGRVGRSLGRTQRSGSRPVDEPGRRRQALRRPAREQGAQVEAPDAPTLEQPFQIDRQAGHCRLCEKLPELNDARLP